MISAASCELRVAGFSPQRHKGHKDFTKKDLPQRHEGTEKEC